MLVKCIYSKISELPNNLLLSDYQKDYEFPFDKGDAFIVYAMMFIDGSMFYLIYEPTMTYPIWCPAYIFEILERHLSKLWVYSFEPQSQCCIWGIPPLIDDSNFYENLLEDDAEALQLFQKYKKYMDSEFPNPLITKSAEALDSQWLYCKDCLDAWESTTLDPMVVCPLCHQTMHNPRYVSENIL